GIASFDGRGSVERTVGTGGKVLIDFGGNDFARALTIDGFGRIVVAGETNAGGNLDFAVARYDVDAGALDPTFGLVGKGTTDFGSLTDDAAYGVRVDALGRIVAVGQTGTGSASDFAVARYTNAGALDTTFSGDGLATVDFSGGADAGRAVTFDGSGKILISGSGFNGTDDDFAAARLKLDGTLDTAFSGDGKALYDFGGAADAANAAAMDGSGKLVLAGKSGADFAVARVLTDGSLDPTFSGDGKATADFGGADAANAVAIDGSARIVLAGQATDSGNLAFGLARFRPDGNLDLLFGTNGKVVTNITPGADVAAGLTVDASGKLVVAGWTDAGGGASAVTVARYHSQNPNIPPTLTGVPASATIPELSAYPFDAAATDPALPPQALPFGLVDAPAGAAIDPITGVFTWTPSEAQGPGVYTFQVRVDDGIDVTQQSITLTVTEVNVAPTLTGVPSSVTIDEM